MEEVRGGGRIRAKSTEDDWGEDDAYREADAGDSKGAE